jgi:hypothetical protein
VKCSLREAGEDGGDNRDRADGQDRRAPAPTHVSTGLVLRSLLLPVASASPRTLCSLSSGLPPSPVPSLGAGADPLPDGYSVGADVVDHARSATAAHYFGTVVSGAHRTDHRLKSHCPKSAARTSSTSRCMPPRRGPGLDGVLTTA